MFPNMSSEGNAGGNVGDVNLNELFSKGVFNLANNQIKMRIPAEDIKKYILKKASERFSGRINVQVVEDGIVIYYDIKSLISVPGTNITVKPETVEVKVPSSDVVNVFKSRFPKADVVWNNGTIEITMSVNDIRSLT